NYSYQKAHTASRYELLIRVVFHRMNIALYLSLQDVQSVSRTILSVSSEKNTYALTVLEFSKMSSSVNIVLITVLVLMSLAE
ncbi:hypothetical protein, partial [Klebsiella pneumoniae]|uniref:hypothetical protein n=1 Tax=Klebsiella pneumoniae TaxID=573 RepID=UPI001C7077B2